ncbi:hypothetical protein PR048_019798 [Dryococelus australis]|uniref:Uncharacterized protein n=1 Tax=Dryococelus australis TaxID=614101 RepID=A0ABQ9H4L0_9NEOP|nr:hypothetical protein PR048_019798 [Dryococelus australis]
MRSLKTSGGITSGSGISEEQRVLWITSSPMSAEYNIAMQEFTNVPYTTSEQHNDLTEARIKKRILLIWKKSVPNLLSGRVSRRTILRTLGDVSAVIVVPDRSIDPDLLFQRFVVVAQIGQLSLEGVMSYELSTFPPALFECRHILWPADKPQLAQAICEHAKDGILDSVPVTEC